MKNRLIFKETWTESVTQQQQQQQLGIRGEDEAFEGIRKLLGEFKLTGERKQEGLEQTAGHQDFCNSGQFKSGTEKASRWFMI